MVASALICQACHHSIKTYENDLGIQPSVIAQIDSANYTTIAWYDTSQNFGSIREGDSVFMKFKFKNTGTKALFLTSVQPSCGCTVADYPRQAITPGGGGVLTATFNSRYHPGYIHKTITVTSNTSNGINHLLSFKGQVNDSLQAKQ
jgi:hypothetical protein